LMASELRDSGEQPATLPNWSRSRIEKYTRVSTAGVSPCKIRRLLLDCYCKSGVNGQS
jgi:hypothetical protein